MVIRSSTLTVLLASLVLLLAESCGKFQSIPEEKRSASVPNQSQGSMTGEKPDKAGRSGPEQTVSDPVDVPSPPTTGNPKPISPGKKQVPATQ